MVFGDDDDVFVVVVSRHDLYFSLIFLSYFQLFDFLLCKFNHSE